MAKAIAQAQFLHLDPLELVRLALVYGCALALIAAGNLLPF